MAVFTWSPDYGLTSESNQSVIRLLFGDGYAQRFTPTINNTVRTFSVSFTLSSDEIDDLEAFLDSYGDVEYFTWTPPDGVEGKFICKDGEWSRSVVNYGQHRLTAVFTEVFEA